MCLSITSVEVRHRPLQSKCDRCVHVKAPIFSLTVHVPALAGPARRGADHLCWWRWRSTTCGHELARARSLFSSGSSLMVIRRCHNDKNLTCTPVSCANFTKQKLPDHSHLHVPPSHMFAMCLTHFLLSFRSSCRHTFRSSMGLQMTSKTLTCSGNIFSRVYVCANADIASCDRQSWKTGLTRRAYSNALAIYSGHFPERKLALHMLLCYLI